MLSVIMGENISTCVQFVAKSQYFSISREGKFFWYENGMSDNCRLCSNFQQQIINLWKVDILAYHLNLLPREKAGLKFRYKLFFSGLYYREHLRPISIDNSKLSEILQQRVKESKSQVLVKPKNSNGPPKWIDLSLFLSQ